MNIWKITGAVVAALAIGGVSAEGFAAQCARFPASGSDPFPPPNRITRRVLTCADGTKSTNSALTTPSPTARQSTTTVLNVLGPSGVAKAQSVGFTSTSRNICISTSRTVGASDFAQCEAFAVSWFGFLRNDNQ